MPILDYAVPVIGGAFILGFVCVLFALIYRLLKMVGVFKLFKRKIKISDEIYEFVIEQINEDKVKAFQNISEHFSNMPRKQQQLYVQAYLEVKDELKGG